MAQLPVGFVVEPAVGPLQLGVVPNESQHACACHVHSFSAGTWQLLQHGARWRVVTGVRHILSGELPAAATGPVGIACTVAPNMLWRRSPCDVRVSDTLSVCFTVCVVRLRADIDAAGCWFHGAQQPSTGTGGL